MKARPARLDPKIPARSVDFVEVLGVLDLCTQTPRTYTQLLSLALENRIVVNREQQPLKKSSFYRNWAALQILGLIKKDGQTYGPTMRGKSVLEAFHKEGSPLGDETKRLLREAMLGSQMANENFFALFATDRTHEPLHKTAAVAIRRNEPRHEYELENLVTRHKYPLSNRLAQGIIWGLRRWAVELGLADELHARPQDGVPVDLSQIMFLVNPDRAPDVVAARFDREVERLISQGKPEYGNTVRVPISWLFYNVCPSAQISTLTARQRLRDWLKRNQHRAFVEGASQPVVRNVRRSNRHGARIPWARQESALLEMQGRYYTFLFCQR